jgi:hypothetical protein
MYTAGKSTPKSPEMHVNLLLKLSSLNENWNGFGSAL